LQVSARCDNRERWAAVCNDNSAQSDCTGEIAVANHCALAHCEVFRRDFSAIVIPKRFF
jgi:hypothetical protein